jgi:hypothetical protein
MRIRHNSRVAATVIAILAVVPVGLAADSDAHVATPLCPWVENARTSVTIDDVELVAPASSQERSEAVAMLTWLDRDQRLRSAISLALAGDVAAFHVILESRDAANLSTYGRFYLNPNRLQCIDDEIERAVIAHLGEPELRNAFTAFFEKNLYQSRELFDCWIDIDFEDGRPHDFNRVVMATLATRLAGIEAEVLAKAKRSLDHDTPARKYALPGVHRRWVEFFGERGYAEAIPYMEDLLLAEGYEETRDSIVAEFSQTRSRVYLTLNEFDSPEVADVFVRQLDRVVRSCPPRFVLYELGAFGSFAVSHAASDEQRRLVSGSFAALLGLSSPADRTPPPGVTDYSTHKKIVELLAELGTTEAAAVLVADLARLTGLDDPEPADSMIASTLEGLRAVPESAELDVPSLLAAAVGLPDHYRLHNLPSILDSHPDPAAHAFYLEQVKWIAANWEGFEHRFHMAPEKALDIAFVRLMAYDEPEQLALTRNALDGLYRAGKPDERRYLASSAELNEALGDESVLYLEVQERRRVAQEQAAQQLIDARDAEWEETVAYNTSPEGIRANVDSLGIRGGQTRLAAKWLVIAGADALDPAHRALADPESSDGSRIALLQVLGEIGDPRSVAPVIEFTRRNAGNRTYLGAGLRALALMPPSAETFDFAGRLLEPESPALSKQQALVYLASVREPLAGEIARKFAASSTEPEVRVAALLLAARLDDRQLRPAIVEMLVTTEDRSYRDVLTRALAELSSVEEFEAFGVAQPGLRDTTSFRDMRALVAFRDGESDLRIEAARDLVASGHPWDRREAVRFLVEEDHGEVLLRTLQFGPPSRVPLLRSILNSPRGVEIFAQLRRMGVDIQETTEGLALVQREGRR